MTLLALAPITALLAAAAIDGDVSIAGEGRGTVDVPRGQRTEHRGSASTTARAGLIIETDRSHADLSYAATLWSIWTSEPNIPDATALDNHRVEARAETRTDRWRLSGAGSALLGYSDPFALLPGSMVTSQVASTRPIPYEAASAQARATIALSPRTDARFGGDWNYSGVLRGDARTVMPPQSSAGADTGVTHLVSDRDTLGLGATLRWSETNAPTGYAIGASVSGEASWRRKLTPAVDGWASAGAAFAYSHSPFLQPRPTRRDLLPVGEVGLASTELAPGLSGEAAVRATTFVDRYTGDVRPSAEARTAVSWQLTGDVTLALSASGQTRLDGRTSVASGTLRLDWHSVNGVTLTAGTLARWQREARPELPSFKEAGVFVGARFALESLAGRPRTPTPPAAAPDAGAQR